MRQAVGGKLWVDTHGAGSVVCPFNVPSAQEAEDLGSWQRAHLLQIGPAWTTKGGPPLHSSSVQATLR